MLSGVRSNLPLLAALFITCWFIVLFQSWKSTNAGDNDDCNDLEGSCSRSPTQFRISADFPGRLGNNLFQFAALYAIARTNNMALLLPEEIADKLAYYFPNLAAVPFETAPRRLIRASDVSTYREIAPMIFSNNVFNLSAHEQDVRLYGFYQSWKYFDDYRDDVRSLFTFRDNTSKMVDSFLEGLISEVGVNQVRFIGIHIRRGDFLQLLDKGFTVSEEEYITEAVGFYESVFRNITFVVCSDDKTWARDHVTSARSRVVISPFEREDFDLCLLSRCFAVVMTTGSFGWWGGWLANGPVVYDNSFPKVGSYLARQFRKRDFFPPEWIGL